MKKISCFYVPDGLYVHYEGMQDYESTQIAKSIADQFKCPFEAKTVTDIVPKFIQDPDLSGFREIHRETNDAPPVVAHDRKSTVRPKDYVFSKGRMEGLTYEQARRRYGTQIAIDVLMEIMEGETNMDEQTAAYYTDVCKKAIIADLDCRSIDFKGYAAMERFLEMYSPVLTQLGELTEKDLEPFRNACYKKEVDLNTRKYYAGEYTDLIEIAKKIVNALL